MGSRKCNFTERGAAPPNPFGGRGRRHSRRRALRRGSGSRDSSSPGAAGGRGPCRMRSGWSRRPATSAAALSAAPGRPWACAQRVSSRSAPARAEPALPQSRRGEMWPSRRRAAWSGTRWASWTAARSSSTVPGRVSEPAHHRSSGEVSAPSQYSSDGSRAGKRPWSAAGPRAVDQSRAASPRWATEAPTRRSGAPSRAATRSTRARRGPSSPSYRRASGRCAPPVSGAVVRRAKNPPTDPLSTRSTRRSPWFRAEVLRPP